MLRRSTGLRRTGFKPPVFVRAPVSTPVRVRSVTPIKFTDLVVATPKANFVECEAYRRLVAALPCINCGIMDYSQAAHPHPTGKSMKEDDRCTFPLCCTRLLITGCHVEFDQYRLFPADQVREVAARWGETTRETIISAGDWPDSLPLYLPTTADDRHSHNGTCYAEQDAEID